MSLTKTSITITAEHVGKRLDQFLVSQLPDLSRARIQELIAQEKVLVNGNAVKASLKLRGNEQIEIVGEVERPVVAHRLQPRGAIDTLLHVVGPRPPPPLEEQPVLFVTTPSQQQVRDGRNGRTRLRDDPAGGHKVTLTSARGNAWGAMRP